METKTMSFRDTIILAMSEEMRRDENVFLMGEDVGVFGGDFGTSVGMLEEFGLVIWSAAGAVNHSSASSMRASTPANRISASTSDSWDAACANLICRSAGICS